MKRGLKLYKSTSFEECRIGTKKKEIPASLKPLYTTEAKKLSDMAAKSLRAYHNLKTRWTLVNSEKAQKLLKDCYNELKTILFHFIEYQSFDLAMKLFTLLGEVAFIAQDYERSIKYYTQAV